LLPAFITRFYNHQPFCYVNEAAGSETKRRKIKFEKQTFPFFTVSELVAWQLKSLVHGALLIEYNFILI
jgi:5'(3')-deoxyribonucleotidase